MTHDRSVAKPAPELGSTRDRVAFLVFMRPLLTGAQREAQQMWGQAQDTLLQVQLGTFPELLI